jgi:hypothetical protein
VPRINIDRSESKVLVVGLLSRMCGPVQLTLTICEDFLVPTSYIIGDLSVASCEPKLTIVLDNHKKACRIYTISNLYDESRCPSTQSTDPSPHSERRTVLTQFSPCIPEFCICTRVFA